MNTDESWDTLREALMGIAPEIDLQSVDPDANLQEELDLDSIDFLNLVEALHERTGVDIPERDYPQLASLNGCARYLSARSRSAGRSGG